MFYSQSLLLRKGPLGIIWVAAHCYKRLKRDQVTGTNISSTVDKIIPDVQLSYRVLAHLLLGVVRIYSKKVDYLFHDCNEVLLSLGRIVLTVQKSAQKREALAQRQKALPQKEKQHNERLNEEDAHHSPEVIRKAHQETPFTFPKTFRLDCFDLELPDEEAVDHFRLEVVDDSDRIEFPNKRHDDEMIARSDFYSGCFTPVEDVSSFGMIDFDFGEWQQTSKSKESLTFEEDPPHSRAKRSLFISVNSCEEPPESLLADMACKESPAEGNVEVQTPLKGCAFPEITVSTPAIRESQRISSKRKCLFDDTIVLSNQIMRQWIHSSSGLVGKRRRAPYSSLDAWRVQKILNIEANLMDPLIPSAARKLDFEISETPIVASAVDVPSEEMHKDHHLRDEYFEDEITLPDISGSSRLDHSPVLQESSSIERESDTQDGWSARTRSVARYLSRCFEQERERELQTSKVLEGKKRTRCAHVFYEILVLKSRGCIHVEQESPYGEIILSATSALNEVSR